MTSHTPGPWEAREGAIYQGGTRLIQAAHLRSVGQSEAQANYDLIAAAPDLLDALIGLLHPGRHDGPCDNPDGGACSKHLVASWGREARARAAIEKATGEYPT